MAADHELPRAEAGDGVRAHPWRGHARGPAPVSQWVGLLLAPAVFAVHLQLGYLLVIAACRQPRHAPWVHVAAIAAVLVAALGVLAAWLAWQRAGAEGPGDEGGPVARTRLLAALGIGMSAIVTLILLAQATLGFVAPMCQ